MKIRTTMGLFGIGLSMNLDTPCDVGTDPLGCLHANGVGEPGACVVLVIFHARLIACVPLAPTSVIQPMSRPAAILRISLAFSAVLYPDLMNGLK